MGGHYVATILIGLGALFFMGAAQRLYATYYRKLSPDEYVWWWRVILGLEAVIWVIGIWPIGWLSLLIWIALYIRLNDEMKFYREHDMRHPIVEFGFASDRPSTYQPRFSKATRALVVVAIIMVFLLAFVNLWLYVHHYGSS